MVTAARQWRLPGGGPRSRRWRIAVAAVATVVVLVALFLVTASVGWPARDAWEATEVNASREVVWDVLTDFEAYGAWNPVVRQVEGELRQPAPVEATVVLPSGERETIHARFSIVRPLHRLGVQYRYLFPGLRDREFEIAIHPLGPDRVRLVLHERVEGPLAPFTRMEGAEQAMDELAAAIRRRAEAVASGSA